MDGTTKRDTIEALTEILLAKAEALGDAHAHEQQLEDDRAAIKADAIVRVMNRDNLKATPAEKVVETDEQYFKHRAEQRASIVARFRADAEYHAAKAALTQASLVTPSAIELQTKIKKLELDLKIQKQERQNAENGRASANRMLAERIDDLRALTERQRRFWEMVGEITPRPDEVFEAWDSSIARRATALTGLEPALGSHDMPGDLMTTRVGGA